MRAPRRKEGEGEKRGQIELREESGRVWGGREDPSARLLLLEARFGVGKNGLEQ